MEDTKEEVTYTDANGEEVNQSDIEAYLEAVRETGAINMCGAAPYIVDNFDLSKKDSRAALTKWMFNK